MNLEDLKNIIILLAIIALIGAATSIGLDDFKTNIDRDSVIVTNESDSTYLVWGNNTNMSLDHDEITVSAVWNCTDQGIWYGLTTGNYTVFSTEGKIQCDTNDSIMYDGLYVCVNYTYLNDPAAINITDNGLRGISSATEYLDTTGTIAGIAVLIGIVVLAFTFIRR